MKKLLVSAGVAGLLFAGSGVALATPPGPGTNPGNGNGPSEKANCVAQSSSSYIHNGQASTLGQGGDPSHGSRGDEIKALQASC